MCICMITFQWQSIALSLFQNNPKYWLGGCLQIQSRWLKTKKWQTRKQSEISIKKQRHRIGNKEATRTRDTNVNQTEQWWTQCDGNEIRKSHVERWMTAKFAVCASHYAENNATSENYSNWRRKDVPVYRQLPKLSLLMGRWNEERKNNENESDQVNALPYF